MPTVSANAGLAAAYQTLANVRKGADAPAASGDARPRLIEDRIDLTTRPRGYQQWPGAAPEGSAFHGRFTSDGLALDQNGHAVVVDPTARTVLIKSANGARIQEWADILNDTSGRVSDLDKAKAHNELVRAWQDDNPNFTADEKRAAAGVANNSVFMVKVEALNERTSRMLRDTAQADEPGYAAETAGLRGWLSYYDSLETWEQEIYAGSRESAEALLSFFERLSAREQAGAHKSGDASPQDPETRWLMSLFNRIGEAQGEFWKTGSKAALIAVRDELAAGFQPSGTRT